MESRGTFIGFLYAVTVGATFSKIGTVGFGLDFVALCLLILVILEDFYLYYTEVLPTEQKKLKTKFIVLVIEASILLAWYLAAVAIGTNLTVFLVTFSVFSLLKLGAGLFHWLSHPDKLDWRFFRYIVFIFVPGACMFVHAPNMNPIIVYAVVFIAWALQIIIWWGITTVMLERESLTTGSS